MKPLFVPVATLFLFSFSATAQVTCGSVLTANATLTSDLNCSSGFTAVEIAADDVTLDLNGFTLSGNILEGIHVSANRVTIRGLEASADLISACSHWVPIVYRLTESTFLPWRSRSS